MASSLTLTRSSSSIAGGIVLIVREAGILSRMTEDRREQVSAFKQLAAILLIAGIGVCIVARWLASPSEVKPSPQTAVNGSPSNTTTPAPVSIISPHEQRLADLRKQQESMEWSIAVEREIATKLYNDSVKMSVEPHTDPDEHQYLLESMDKEHQRITELLQRKKTIDDELAQDTNATPATAPAPPASIAPESGDSSRSAGNNDQSPIPGVSLKELNAAVDECEQSLRQMYSARILGTMCRCMAAVGYKTGSKEQANEARVPCAELAVQQTAQSLPQ